MTQFLAKVAIWLMVLVFPLGAQAQEPEAGVGLICDTPDQLKEIVELATVSRNFEASVEKVNNGSNACGVAQVLYLKGEKVGQVRSPDGLRDIVKIIIVGLVTPQGVMPVPPLVQYTMFPSKDREV